MFVFVKSFSEFWQKNFEAGRYCFNKVDKGGARWYNCIENRPQALFACADYEKEDL